LNDSHSKSSVRLDDPAIIESLQRVQRGIEKEGLRVEASDSTIAQTGHPAALGSTLTHPSITTDYSEALLEFITPKLAGIDETIAYLTDLHSYTLRNLNGELVWPASMPCRLEGDESIPIAQYGSSNVGQMKHVYRQGLGVRYGRTMQSIAGIHYNFSLPDRFWLALQAQLNDSSSLKDFKSEQYFSLIRNFRRYSWILHYLFGASPVVDDSFLSGQDHELEQFSDRTYGLTYGTSLRMSDLGYQNSAQDGLQVSYNSLEDYTETLGHAVHQSYAAYENIGTKVTAEGVEKYIQLNTNILQLENEYYSDIRPKRVTESGEKPIHALRSRGVEYIEVRILDINPFIAEGIDAEQIRFLDAFLLHCLMSQCPLQSNATCEEIRGNQRNVIMRGRDPNLQLVQEGKASPFKVAANQLLDCVTKTANMLDQSHGGDAYKESVSSQREKVENTALTPSGKIMQAVQSGTDFSDLASDLADQHRRYFETTQATQLSDSQLQKIAGDSLSEQVEMEQSDSISFAEYLAAYNAPD